MSEWRNRFNEFIADWMRRSQDLPCASVVSVVSNTTPEDLCDTCGPGLSYDVDVVWVDYNGKRRYSSFAGRLEHILSN